MIQTTAPYLQNMYDFSTAPYLQNMYDSNYCAIPAEYV
jgi:hypothetical protein